MASFTDAIPQFNPYIQQLPVEAMVAVGMEKQQRYDQGLQRIQSQIDQVAGLSIYRPQDRQYLQSKLNDLGSKLKTVAAGDFSNYQLVNSVAGMAGSVAKDPTIISSVQSTAQRRAIQEKIQKDVDSGNYNPANSYLYNLSDDEWINNPNVGAKYTGYYKTPVDVWGKIKDIAKEVGVDERVVPNLFETDERGRIKKDENGKAIFNNVMVEETFKGKDASKILNAFQNALTPSDYEQLSIEGRYNYRGISPEKLQQTVADSLDKDIKMNNGKIELLKISLAEEENKAKTNQYDEALITSLKDEIKYFEGRNTQIETSKRKSLEAIAKDPEAAKANLYTENYLSSMSEVLSSKAVSKKYSVNPHFEVSMKINEFERQQTQWLADYNLRRRADDRAQKEHDTKMEALAAQAAYFQAGGIDTPIDADPAMVRAMVEGSYSESVAQYNTITNKLALETLRMANPGDTEEQLQKKLYDAAAYRGQTINPNSGEINTTAQIMASSLQTLYRTNPDKVPKTLHGLIAQADNTLKGIEAQRSVMQKAREDAKQAATLQGVDLEAYEKAVKSVKPTSVSLATGESVNLSQQDLIDYVNLHPEQYNFFGSLTVDKDQEMLKNQAQIRLGSKFGQQKMREIEKVLYPRKSSTVGLQTELPSTLMWDISTSLKDAGQQSVDKLYAEAYQKNGAVPVGKIATIDKGDQKTEDYRNKFIAVLSKYELDLDEDVYNNLSNAVLSDAFGATVTTLPGANLQSPSTYTLKITGKDGSSEMIEIERNDYRFLTGYEPPANPNLKNAFDLLNARGTTNLNKSGEYSTAYFKTQDFTNFSSNDYSLMGDLEEDALDPNIVYPRIYIFDKNDNSFKKSFLIGDVALPKIINGQINPQLEAFSSAVTAQFIKETTNFPIY
jgi:hypothetical protein